VPGLSGTYIGGVGSSAGQTERLMAFFGGTSQDRHFYLIVFDKANPANRVIVNTHASTVNGVPTAIPLNFSLHHVAIDHSGRYLMLYPTGADQAGTRKAPQSVVWDTQTNTFTELGVTARPYGHDALGYGMSVNQDCCTATSWDAAQWQFRSLANPLQTRDVITNVLTPKVVYMADHPTWNNARPDRLTPFISGLYRFGADAITPRAWDDEIVAVQPDAPAGADAIVWRFAHHRSDVRNDIDPARSSFWYMPRPNVSPDGRWVLFTSNWEKTLGTDPTGEAGSGARQDVFLVKLTAADATPSTPPPPPPPVLVPVAIATPSLPSGRMTVAYTAALQATGGKGSYLWSIAGTLPAGLGFDAAAATISGTPGAAGTYAITITATDADDASNTGRVAYSLAIANVVKIMSPRTLPVAYRNTPYSYAVQAANVQGPASWSLAGGKPPPGMTLDRATGVITGICTTKGTYHFNARIVDASTTDTLTLTIQVK
jgi:hypothetical protein